MVLHLIQAATNLIRTIRIRCTKDR